jgi:hypothetical protein
MGFASAYLEERTLFPELIKEVPDRQTGIIVVIPSYNEPGITDLLDSLAMCNEPGCRVEVIIVINAPAGASEQVISNNMLTVSRIDSWKKNNNCFFRLFAIDVGQPCIPRWGVGMARKAGMDEAARRFNVIGRPEGVIVNLDADCLVKKNYFECICNELLIVRERNACSIYFEHPVKGTEFRNINYAAVILYELHLRYYYQGLILSGFPYVFHTVGSAIAVKSLPYIKAGGMNRRTAGEDFYFVQKIVNSGAYVSLNSTTVYPSPRVSSRVPFGTGATMAKLAVMERPELLTYNLKSFIELRSFFNLTDEFYNVGEEELLQCLKKTPQGVAGFLDGREAYYKILEIKKNTTNILSFKKRFFSWFNMFMVVKYMNHAHQSYFRKTEVAESASLLLNSLGSGIVSKDPAELLHAFRLLEKPDVDDL